MEENKEDEEEGETELAITYENIVATVRLTSDSTLNLHTLSTSIKNAEYNPKRFPAMIMRIREPRTTALVFQNGKMIVTGAKSIDASEQACKKYTAIIQQFFPHVRYEGYTIHNMTATCALGFPISLEGLLYANPKNCTYEPELFPGLVYRMTTPKIVLLIFVSGKIVLTGAKKTDDFITGLSELYETLSLFRKKVSILRAPPPPNPQVPQES